MKTQTLNIINLLDELETLVLKNSKSSVRDFPIARIHLGYFLSLLQSNKIELEKFSEAILYKKYKFNLKGFFKLIRLSGVLFILKIYNRNILKNKVLIFGFVEHYYKQGTDKMVNLYLSPIKEEFTNKGIGYDELLVSYDSSAKIELSRLKVFYDALYQYYSLQFSLKNKCFNNTKSYIVTSELIKSFMEGKKINGVNHFSNLFYNIQIEQEIKYNVFKQLLKISNPKLIWTYCYYDNNMLAIIKAANKLEIKSIEYQHSQQSDEHFAYSMWKNSDVYKEFFPNTFWVWKQSDADRVLRNFSSKNYRPNIIVGGNLSAIKQKEQFNYKAPEANKGILVSLQGSWIPKFVEEFIEKDMEHIWYFRLHPRYPEDKQKLISLKTKFPDKVEIDEANNLSLYELFYKVKINITDFSGTALEAAEFGIKNIIIGEKGAKIYSEKIMNGDYTFADSSIKLMNTINDFVNTEADLSQVILKDRENLNHIMSKIFN